MHHIIEALALSHTKIEIEGPIGLKNRICNYSDVKGPPTRHTKAVKGFLTQPQTQQGTKDGLRDIQACVVPKLP